MNDQPRGPIDALLDRQFNRLEGDELDGLESALQEDAALRAASDRLDRMLEPLDLWRVAPPPNLADDVLAFVERSRREQRLTIPSVTGPGGARRLRFMPMRDLLAAAACILLLIGVFVPTLSGVRRRARQSLCASNLEGVFGGVSAYGQLFGDTLPFAGVVPGASWLPGGEANRPFASNSRHTFLMVKGRLIEPSAFLCPCDPVGEPMNVADVDSCDDFPSHRNISYDTINLAGNHPDLRPSQPVAYLGDANPLFVGARFNASIDPDNTNSPAHQGRGQLVLSLDGSAAWITTPFHGRRGDNLWLIGNIRHYTGLETPVRDGDVQLIPGHPGGRPLHGSDNRY